MPRLGGDSVSQGRSDGLIALDFEHRAPRAQKLGDRSFVGQNGSITWEASARHRVPQSVCEVTVEVTDEVTDKVTDEVTGKVTGKVPGKV